MTLSPEAPSSKLASSRKGQIGIKVAIRRDRKHILYVRYFPLFVLQEPGRNKTYKTVIKPEVWTFILKSNVQHTAYDAHEPLSDKKEYRDVENQIWYDSETFIR